MLDLLSTHGPFFASIVPVHYHLRLLDNHVNFSLSLLLLESLPNFLNCVTASDLHAFCYFARHMPKHISLIKNPFDLLLRDWRFKTSFLLFLVCQPLFEAAVGGDGSNTLL